MNRKKTSFLGPFVLTFLCVLVIGLFGMYYGYYQGRITRYEQYIAELQSKPDPEINLSFQVDDSGVSRGLSMAETAGEQTESESSETAETGSGDGMETSSVEKPVKMGACGTTQTKVAKPIARKSGQSPVNRSMERSTTQTGDDDDEDTGITRGPAFPSSRQRAEEEEQAASDRGRDIPDINDPELDDNPLIRALREASRHQDENPGYNDNASDPPKNPFEAILNNQGN